MRASSDASIRSKARATARATDRPLHRRGAGSASAPRCWHNPAPPRCAEAVDPGDPALPVAGSGSLSGVRKSTRGRWRAAVLIGVHLLIALHIAHFLSQGRTLSPVEPSESMYTLELGQLNAGFIFFLVALLSTAVAASAGTGS